MVSKPLERVLIRYDGVPRQLEHIVRLERPLDEQAIRANILHNALARYFVPRLEI